MFFKMVALKILQFHNFIGKHLYGSLFNKVADPQNTTLLKSDSSTGVFLWNLRSFSEYLFFGTSPVAASDSFKFSACNFIKKETPAKIFFCQVTVSYVYLWILGNFSSASGKLLCSCTSCRILTRILIFKYLKITWEEVISNGVASF